MSGWRAATGGIGLAPKLIATTVLVLVAVAASLSTVATTRMSLELEQGFESRGEAIAIGLATTCEQNTALDISSIQGAIDANKIIYGVKYIYLTDPSGKPHVHTFSPTFPDGLEQRNPIGLGEDLGGKRVKVSREAFRSAGQIWHSIDLAAPVAGASLGVVHVGMDADLIASTIEDFQRTMLRWAAAIALSGIAVSLLVTIFVVIRPVRELTRIAGDIVERGDLTQRVEIESRDEIGELAVSFGEMVAKLRAIAAELANSTHLLASSAEELRAFTASQRDLVARYAAELERTRATASGIGGKSELAAKKAAGVLAQADRADSAGRAGERALGQSQAAMRDIRAQVEEITERITTLSGHAVQVARVTHTVHGLADQSNGLANKAADSATRASGSVGGFGLIASEIRGLADRSIKETHRVREIAEEIGTAVHSTVSITQRGMRQIDLGLEQLGASETRLTELSTISRQNASMAREIGAAVREQHSGIAELLAAVDRQSRMTADTRRGLEATEAVVMDIVAVSKRLVQIMAGFRY
ncbi:MAG TPA: methyl-accepting chemotaxis protein [Polyangiaceae bacterium]|nr:methyl-accepting chemotaxis protein [Polyangiaceae bacterium]